MHLIESRSRTLDEEGVDLPDLAAARSYAIEAARDILAEDLRAGNPLDLSRHIDVTGDAGDIVLSVSFQEAITIVRYTRDHFSLFQS